MDTFLVGILYILLFYGSKNGIQANSVELKFKNFAKNLEKQSFAFDKATCDLHLNKTIEAYLKHERWAWKMYDSLGTLPSGLLLGHSTNIGNFDECVNTKAYSSDNRTTMFNGQYCLAKLQTTYLQNENYNYTIGVCFPDSCEPEYLQKIIRDYAIQSNKTMLMNITISKSDCVTNEPKKLQVLEIAALAVLGFFVLLVAISTLYEYIVDICKKKKHASVASFSLISNTKILFSVSNDFKDPLLLEENIDCLHSIRFLSVIWVVYTYVRLDVFLPATINPNDFDNWLGNPYSLVFQNSNLAVDSFLLLSGLLVAYAGLKKGGMKNIPLLYVHRYLRITPVLGLTIWFTITLSKYFGNGPFWKLITEYGFGNCKQWWWTSILYVQNYVNPNDLCLPHTWPLSVDTQLFLISPLLLVPLLKWGWKVIAIPIILALASVAASFGIFYMNQYHLLIQFDVLNMADRIKDITIPTHTRAAPWAIGVLFGYILHVHRGKALKMPIWTTVIGWIISIFVFIVTGFGYFYRLNSNSTTLLEGAFYESFSRIAWAIALGWIIITTAKGYGGPIGDLLSLPFWRPFSRLTYCIYILHLIVATLIFANRKTDSHFSDFDTIVNFHSVFGITLIISVVVALIYEIPIRVLDHIILKKCFYKENDKTLEEELSITVEKNKEEVEQVEMEEPIPSTSEE